MFNIFAKKPVMITVRFISKEELLNLINDKIGESE